MHVPPIFVVAAVALGAAYIINHIYLRIYHARKAKSLHCGEVVTLPAGGWTGISLSASIAKAVNEFRFNAFVKDQYETLSAKHGRRVGTFGQRVALCRDILVTSDPENFKAILATQFKEFDLGVGRREAFKPVFGTGIFATEGKRWEHSRALGRRQFARAHVSNVEIEEDHVQALMSVLDGQIGANGWTDLLDLQVFFQRLTLDSATEFLFGQSVNTQIESGTKDAGHGSEVELSEAIEKAMRTTAHAVRLGPKYWLMFNKQFYRNVEIVHKFTRQFVLKALSYDEKAEQEKYNYLQSLTKETHDPKEIEGEVLSLLFAGRDTTAATLSWFFHVMSRHPKAYQKLRTVVLDEFGTYSSPREITYETMKACQYLQWCINETLRVHSVAPFLVRSASIDTTLPTGGGPDGKSPVYVKKGTVVSLTLGQMHLRTDIWGEDASEFRPERWEKSRKAGWDYIPFSGGPRICIGQQFALTETAYVVIRMVQRFEDLDGSKLGPISSNLLLVDTPGTGVNLRLKVAE